MIRSFHAWTVHASLMDDECIQSAKWANKSSTTTDDDDDDDACHARLSEMGFFFPLSDTCLLHIRQSGKCPAPITRRLSNIKWPPKKNCRGKLKSLQGRFLHMVVKYNQNVYYVKIEVGVKIGEVEKAKQKRKHRYTSKSSERRQLMDTLYLYHQLEILK